MVRRGGSQDQGQVNLGYGLVFFFFWRSTKRLPLATTNQYPCFSPNIRRRLMKQGSAVPLPQLPLSLLLACLPFSLLRLRSFASTSVRLRCRFLPTVSVLPVQDRGLPRKYLTLLSSRTGWCHPCASPHRVCFYSGLGSCQP